MSDGPEGEHIDERLALETVSFIESHKDQLFFAYFCLYSVHVPLQGKKDLVSKYEQKANRLKIEEQWGTLDKSKVRLTQSHATYAAMVETMDGAVGTVLDALDRLGLTDNTLVIFLSDNGGLSTAEGQPTSNAPLKGGKGWLYEGGVRVPCIVAAPFVSKNSAISDAPIAATDFYPTILDLAGLPLRPQQHVDGYSFANIVRTEAYARPAPIYWHYPHFGNQGGHPASAILDGNLKLIEDLRDHHLELYNLATDPNEEHDLAKSDGQTAQRLLEKLDGWRKEVHAAYPQPAKEQAQ